MFSCVVCSYTCFPFLSHALTTPVEFSGCEFVPVSAVPGRGSTRRVARAPAEPLSPPRSGNPAPLLRLEKRVAFRYKTTREVHCSYRSLYTLPQNSLVLFSTVGLGSC
jgi:hypothetical protein